MARKKGKKRSGPEQSRDDASGSAIPGSSREQPPCSTGSAAAGGRKQEAKEQASVPVQVPKPKQPEQRRQDAPASNIPGMASTPNVPSSSREQPPCSTGAAAAGGRKQGIRQQALVPAEPLKSKQPAPSDPGRSDVSGRPSLPPTSGLELSRQLGDLALEAAMPRKPKQPGRLGRPISLISNCYPLKFTGCYVYHYDIEMSRIGTNYSTPGSGSSPDAAGHKDDRKKYRCLNTKLNRIVFRKLCGENLGGSLAVYDGERNVYCMKQLPVKNGETFEVRIVSENPGEPGDPRGPKMDIFEAIIKPVEKKESGDNIINLEPLNELFRGRTTSVPLDAVMVLETVLRYVPCLRFVPVGRNFYSPPNSRHPLGNGKVAWFGHHQSVRLAQTTPVVNLNITASSFYESVPVIEYVEKLLSDIRLDKISALSRDQISKISKDMKNICVETTHVSYRRKYRIDGLSQESANKQKFDFAENNRVNKITVESYYRTRYNVRLRYPHLPCLKVKNRDSFLPMEICEIVKGQHSNRELNPKQQAEMIKYTSKPPQERFAEIERIRRDSNYNNDPYLRSFGLRVLDEPLMVDGRTMEAPNVVYKWKSDEIRERPRFGSWNMKDKQFYTGTRIKKWTLVSFASEDECHFGKLKQFAAALHRFANQQGVEMDECLRIQIAEAKLQSVRFYIEGMKSQFHAELIFIVLPMDRQRTPGRSEKLSQTLYSEVKRIAETTIGIVTQCVKGENVVAKGTNPSFVSNLCLKMNAKMGGVNNSMIPAEVSMQPKEAILFIGADVNHPAPTENTRYSLAAVVGNLDMHPSRYAVTVRAQKNDKNFKKMVEVILNMQEMMRSLLIAYYKTTRMKPKKIIVYRDGVSDGQFSDVQAREIEWIRNACTGLEPGYKPGITFIVIQKRHHVRFLPERRRENPPPGTVVDTTVTHPLNFDFFLYSHNGMKGTSRPSYYTVLADDNKFGFDALEKMTYSLCYTYVRCTKSISLPAPVQYADLAAYRARRHLNSHLADLEIRGKVNKEDDGKFNIKIEEVQGIIDVQDCMKDTMYYA